MRIAIVGLGMGGATLACLLADRGADVTVLEQAEDPRPVGAGICLQSMGQQVLDRLDLLEPLAAVSRPVSRVRIERATGRELLDFSYDAVPGAVPGAVPALGVHRGALFCLLHEAVLARGVPVHLGVSVTGVRPTAAGITVETAAGDHSSYDLVVVRRQPLPGPAQHARRGPGRRRRPRDEPPARHRHLAALADAWALDHALAAHADLPTAVAAYAGGRARHVRWYQWWTRLMMPVFQSDLTPLAWPRDLLAPVVMRVAGMTGQAVTTLLGDRTSPWSSWDLP